MVLTFMGLGDLVVVPIHMSFWLEAYLPLFSNCPLLRASSILVPQLHSSPNELIGDDRSLLL